MLLQQIEQQQPSIEQQESSEDLLEESRQQEDAEISQGQSAKRDVQFGIRVIKEIPGKDM